MNLSLSTLKERFKLLPLIVVALILVVGFVELVVGKLSPFRPIPTGTLSEAALEVIPTTGVPTDLFVTTDGRILYQEIKTFSRELWSYSLQTKQRTQVAGLDKLKIESVAWSRDGKGLVTDQNSVNYILASGHANVLPFRGYGFSWNPQATKLAFFSDRSFSSKTPTGLSVYDLASAKITNLFSDSDVVNRRAFWSPDGTKILFQEHSDEGEGLVSIVNVNGSGKKIINIPQNSTNLSWSPNSHLIGYQVGDKIWELNVSNSAVREAFKSPSGAVPAVFAWADDETLIVADSGNDQTILYQASAGGVIRNLGSSDRVKNVTGLVILGNRGIMSGKDGLYVLAITR